MPAKHRAIIDTAMDALALKTMMRVLVDNGEAKAMLPAKGVTFYNWSEEDRATFRAAAKDAWDDWAKKTPETAAIVESHKAGTPQGGGYARRPFLSGQQTSQSSGKDDKGSLIIGGGSISRNS